MEKVWYLLIKGNKEGPFSFAELKQDLRLTPDTLVWRKGFPKWVPIRFVPELKELFEEKTPPKPIHELKKTKVPQPPGGETIALRREPPWFYFWLFILIIFIFYALFQIYF
jgi:hypothetical protein